MPKIKPTGGQPTHFLQSIQNEKKIMEQWSARNKELARLSKEFDTLKEKLSTLLKNKGIKNPIEFMNRAATKGAKALNDIYTQKDKVIMSTILKFVGTQMGNLNNKLDSMTNKKISTKNRI